MTKDLCFGRDQRIIKGPNPYMTSHKITKFGRLAKFTHHASQLFDVPIKWTLMMFLHS